MAKIAANEAGVAELRRLSTNLSKSAETIAKSVPALQSALDEEKNGLGPHDNTIEKILENMRTVTSEIGIPVFELADTLNDLADTFEEIIDDDIYSGQQLQKGPGRTHR